MMNKEKNFISAVIYIHNAEERVGDFLKMIMAVLEKNFEHSEIICVNDRSDDNSMKRIREISSGVRATSITILNMSYFHGLELAMNAGVDLAIGDFVFEFDHMLLGYGEKEIMDVYWRALDGYDIVSAIPDQKRRLSSRVFYRLFNRFSKLSYQIDTESFRILSRRVINRISSMNKAVPYRKAIYANCGLSTDKIIYHMSSDKKENDKLERTYRRRLAVDSFILFTDIGYSFSITMTFLMMIMSIFMVLYSLVCYLVMQPAGGWTTTILFLSVAFFGLFGILTIMIKYLQLLVDLVFKRKRYSFENIEKLTR